MKFNAAFISVLILAGTLFSSCNPSEREINLTELKGGLELLPSKETGIDFNNTINESIYFNHFYFSQIYSGAGVAIGDLNNDGLPDIFFCGNQVGDKLYINNGGFKFEDITKSSNISKSPGWSWGVTMADVNADGYLDIYVSRNGESMNPLDRKNKLFINNKDLTFTESARSYGLDDAGFSTQAVFFDMDKDGDLDLFVLNHSLHPNSNYGKGDNRKRIDDISGDKLLENIEKSKQNNLEKLLFGLGIRHVGEKVSKVIADKYRHLEDYTRLQFDDLVATDEIGNVIAESVLAYFKDEDSIQLIQELKREPQPEEVAERMGISVEKVQIIQKVAQEPISLESPVGEEEDSSLGDFIPDPDTLTPMEFTSKEMLKRELDNVLETLTDREEKVLRMRFGLLDGRSRTLEEVGREFGVTRERIRQIEAKALRKLRHPSRSKKLKDFMSGK